MPPGLDRHSGLSPDIFRNWRRRSSRWRSSDSIGEAKRTLKVLDGRLAEAEYVAGEYSIADILANFSWVWRREFAGVDLTDTPHVARWYAAIEARGAVQRAISALTF